MPKGIYSEEVNYEEIKFDSATKKEVKEKKLAKGSGLRIERGETDKDDIYFEHRTVGFQGMRVEEGQAIVSFPDGRQILLSQKEFKEKVKPAKGKDDAAESGNPVVVLPLSDGTQQMLTQEQSKKLVDEAAKKTADGTAGNDQGKTNPIRK